MKTPSELAEIAYWRRIKREADQKTDEINALPGVVENTGAIMEAMQPNVETDLETMTRLAAIPHEHYMLIGEIIHLLITSTLAEQNLEALGAAPDEEASSPQ